MLLIFPYICILIFIIAAISIDKIQTLLSICVCKQFSGVTSLSQAYYRVGMRLWLYLNWGNVAVAIMVCSSWHVWGTRGVDVGGPSKTWSLCSLIQLASKVLYHLDFGLGWPSSWWMTMRWCTSFKKKSTGRVHTVGEYSYEQAWLVCGWQG